LVQALDALFSKLQGGWQYAVEIRKKTFLHDGHFRDAPQPWRGSRIATMSGDRFQESATSLQGTPYRIRGDILHSSGKTAGHGDLLLDKSVAWPACGTLCVTGRGLNLHCLYV
jgi:hypothetical protein